MKTSHFSVLRMMGVVAVSSLAVLSCQKNNSSTGSSGKHSVSIFLTDDPSFSFDNFFVDIQKLEIKVEDSIEDEHEHGGGGGDDNGGHGGDDHSGNWITLNIRAGIYDVLQFRNGLDTILASETISLRTIRKVRITLGNNNSVVLKGVSTPLPLNGNDNIIEIKLSDDFLDDNPANIRFSLDFDAGSSVKFHGDRLEFRPRINAFRKEKAGSIEGRVLPEQAQAMVTAFNGTDTATAKPEREGEFKVVGLKAGVYSVLVHATSGNYKDTTLTNIVVAGKEDTHVGTITLRQ